MKVLVTGSSGHLGEAMVRHLQPDHDVVSIDIKRSEFTNITGSISNRELVRQAMQGVEVVFHAATLHKPHVATHTKQQFVDTNITGTLILLEEAVSAGVRAFIFTSTTSVFGDALAPPRDQPAAWITEEVTPIPKNIYGVTKTAAEDLCKLFHRNHGLACIILRTSRFFPEDDDRKDVRDAFEGNNAKANEFLYRRVAIDDIVTAHILAAKRAVDLGFGKYIITATTPFTQADLVDLRHRAPEVLAKYYPEYADIYRSLGWRMFDDVGRVYVNAAARKDLGWQPAEDFGRILERVKDIKDPLTPLARTIGLKGYHDQVFEEGPFPVLDH